MRTWKESNTLGLYLGLLYSLIFIMSRITTPARFTTARVHGITLDKQIPGSNQPSYLRSQCNFTITRTPPGNYTYQEAFHLFPPPFCQSQTASTAYTLLP